jgi:hypothetical protein
VKLDGVLSVLSYKIRIILLKVMQKFQYSLATDLHPFQIESRRTEELFDREMKERGGTETLEAVGC